MDKILEKLFQPERWEGALRKGLVKGISHQTLRELMSPEGRIEMLRSIAAGDYVIERPHTARIPKDTPGEWRVVYVNSGRDRVFLALANDLLFEIMPEMVHPTCKSYQKGIGTQKVVSDASRLIADLTSEPAFSNEVVGWKADLSKYFDSVPIRFIDAAFDAVEAKWGRSKVIDVLRKYYHCDLYYDSETKTECEKYQSLKQGCAVASWLADVVLYHIDEWISTECKGMYVRYSDDTLYIGRDWEKAMRIMTEELEAMEMKLNPKKVELIDRHHWFKFLGFSIKGEMISLSSTRIKTFMKEVKSRTVDRIRSGVKYENALRNTLSWLYRGDGEHSWATGCLKTITSEQDINTLNGFVMDCLRAVRKGKPIKASELGGLGWERRGTDGCISRGKGSKVKSLRESGELEGYTTIKGMRQNMMFGKDLYWAVVRNM